MSIMSLQFTFFILCLCTKILSCYPLVEVFQNYMGLVLLGCVVTPMPVLAIGRLQAVETSFHTDVQEKEDGHEG